MHRKILSAAACLSLLSLLVSCGSAPPDRWQRGKNYVWVPPRTGSYVGRWVAKDEDNPEAKPARAKKKARANSVAKAQKSKPREKPAEPEPSASSPPPDRFR